MLPTGVTLASRWEEDHSKGRSGRTLPRSSRGGKSEVEGNQVEVLVSDTENSQSRAFWGLTRALIANMVIGVSEGYKKSLEIQG